MISGRWTACRRVLVGLVVALVMSACSSDGQSTVASPGDGSISNPSEPAAVIDPGSQQPTDESGSSAGAIEPDAGPLPDPVDTRPDESNGAAPLRAIELVPHVSGIERVTNITHAGDDRIFVTTQDGQVLIVREGRVADRPFLDIAGRLDSRSSERGLLDVAFDPDYADNGRLFVNYTDRDGSTVISQFTVSQDRDRADPDSEAILLKIVQPFRNHNGGHLEFGPDGYLYVAMGDGGSGGDPRGNGQNTETLLGAILRIDVAAEAAPYGVPAENPFVGDESVRDEIWAYGVRNPWGVSFDSATGDLYFADVGQDSWEEINRQPAGVGGQNYGWNITEADTCFERSECDRSGLTPPLLAYAHEQGRCSVTGGVIYRGPDFLSMQGTYFFGDFCDGTVWATDVDDVTFATSAVFDGELSTAAFGTDAAGNVYLADRLSDTIFRIEPAE